MGKRRSPLADLPDKYAEAAAVLTFGKHFGGIAAQDSPKSPTGGRGICVDGAHVALLFDRQDANFPKKWEPRYHVSVSGDLVVNAARTLDALQPRGEIRLAVYDTDYPIAMWKDDGRYAVLLAPRIEGHTSPEPMKKQECEAALVAVRNENERLNSLIEAQNRRLAALGTLEGAAVRYAREASVENLTALIEHAKTVGQEAR